MSKHFQTAEDLMEYLKKQIVHYSNGEDVDQEEELSSIRVNESSLFNLSRLSMEREANNVLWNVSAERPITSHRKLTGKLIVFSKKLIRKLLRWYVSHTFELQSAFNGSVTRSINEITNALQNLSSKIDQMDMLVSEHYQSSLNQQAAKLEALELQIKCLNKMESDIETLKSENAFMASNNSAKIEATNRQAALTQEQFNNELNFLNYRIRKIMKSPDKDAVSIPQGKTSFKTDGVQQTQGDFDYLHFENKFRGSIEEIKNRQKVYLPYFINSSNVLDIGCGRGEFIELLIENNISVSGIDLNDDMVEYCQDRGLPVNKDDAVNILNSVEDASLGGIFLGQVIEHMPFDQIIITVELAFKKLKPGSYLVMETPNPLSLAIFYRTFYVDPTHVKPVHPLTIQYVVESVGFSKTELQYSSRVESNWWLPKLQCDENSSINNIEEFNHGVERINNLLYGNLDYAIIAKK